MKTLFSILAASVLAFATSTSSAATLIMDDFEGDILGAFPTARGWSDVGQVKGAGVDVPKQRSATVVSTTDAFDQPTQAVSMPEAFATSQGIFQSIASTPFIGISADVRVDRYATRTTGRPAYDFAWGIGLVQIGSRDFYFSPYYGTFAAAKTQTAWSLVYRFSAGRDDFELGGPPLATGTWYNVNLGLDLSAGAVSVVITDIAANSQVLNAARTVPQWRGLAAEPPFNAVAFSEDEGTAHEQTNLTLFDNIIVADTAVPITLPPRPAGGLSVE